MSPVLLRLLFGLLFSAIISGLAYRRRSLSPSGVVGAVLVGTVIFTFGGAAFGLLLITFFVLSNLLSRVQHTRKEQLAQDKFDKTDRRDLGQALANGGAAMIFAVLYVIVPTNAVLAAFVAAIATVNADTWATEVGVLSKSQPRSIMTFKPVKRGTSGGITATGTMATAAGAAVIAGAAVLLLRLEGLTEEPAWWLLPVALFGGITGSLIDSFLGATVQVMYYSERRQEETERPIDADGTRNTPIRGLSWMTNDWVNFLSSLGGAAVGALLTLAI